MQQLLTTAEAAKYLGLSTSTLEHWRLSGEGPKYLKFPRAVRYRPDDLERFLAYSERGHTSQAA